MFYYKSVNSSVESPENITSFVENFQVYDIFSSNFSKELRKIPESGRVTVEVGEKARPDLLSFRIYGNTKYWSHLLDYNDISCVEDLKSGLVLKFFSLSELLYLLSTLRVKTSKNSVPDEVFIRKDKF